MRRSSRIEGIPRPHYDDTIRRPRKKETQPKTGVQASSTSATEGEELPQEAKHQEVLDLGPPKTGVQASSIFHQPKAEVQASSTFHQLKTGVQVSSTSATDGKEFSQKADSTLFLSLPYIMASRQAPPTLATHSIGKPSDTFDFPPKTYLKGAYN